MKILIGVVPARDVELFALGRAAADKHGVELAAVEKRLEAVHRRVVADLDAHIDDVADFFVEDLLGQTERRDVDAHQPARPRQFLEDGDGVAERHQIVGDRQRGRTGADEADLLAVLDRRRSRDEVLDLVAIVRRDPLQPADGDGLAIDARAAAGGLARPIARTSKDARKDVGLPIEEVGIGVPALRNHPDVLRHVRMRGTRPLTVHHAVVVVGVANVGRLHQGVIIGHPAKRLSTDDL